MVMKGGMGMRTIMKHCRLIPELSGGYDGGYGDVVLAGDNIQSVSSQALPEDGDTVIDCCGKTLLPGLFDIHAHLNWDYYNGLLRLNDFKLMVSACLSAQRFLELGITTIRDMGAPKGLSVYVRDAIRQGLFNGPRIVTGGSILRPTAWTEPADPHCFLRYVSGVEDFVRAAREEMGAGADFVKLYAQGEPPELLPEELEAVVRIAHRYKRRVAVHAHDATAISMCLDAGADTIEHGSYIRPEDIRRLKDSVSTYLVPTLAVLSSEVPTPGFTPTQKARMLKPLLDANACNITAAYQAGLVLGFGTDTPVEEQLKLPGLEFRMRKTYCRMDNIDMLLQATRYSARICGLENVTGSIAAGLAADVILVDGQPDQDIAVMYRKPELVVAGGIMHRPRQDD